MPFIYCTQCGYKNTFTTQKAKFCAGCGQSLLTEVTSARVNPTSSPQSAPSNSSIKIMHGDCSLALLNRSRTRLAPTPTNNSTNYNFVEMTHHIWLVAIIDFLVEKNIKKQKL